MSEYFNDFISMKSELSEQATLSEYKSENDESYKKLLKELYKLVSSKRKEYVKNEVPKIIRRFEDEGAFPKFSDNKYEQARKEDLITVVKEIYCIQPRIFHKLNPEQKKSILGFLNLLLNTDERENIITIIDNITKLSAEEREDLSNVLKKTSLSKIIATIKMIENRYCVVQMLKSLVFDYGKFANERDHIQNIIENNYWLFGEQYSLVSADINFEKALKEYLYLIDNNDEQDDYKIDNQERLRRPDVFLCRKRMTEDASGSQLEENIILELKAPGVPLNKTVHRQVEDYMSLICKEPKFNSQLRTWKLIAVCCQLDDDIVGRHEAFKEKGKRFLTHQMRNFEIYAMTWDDVFKSFDLRHRYIYEKLNFDKAAIEEELAIKGIEFSRAGANEIRDKILSIGSPV